MKIVAAKKDLLKALARVQGVAQKKSTMPALSCAVLESKGGALTVSATDLYVSLSSAIDAGKKSDDGAIAAPAKDLYERVKLMPDGDVTLSKADGSASVRVESHGSPRKFNIPDFPHCDFPPMPSPESDAPSMSMTASGLATLISKTHFSISTDETRAHLNSALFEWGGGAARIVTTDGHRLSKADMTTPGHQASASMLISAKGVQELRRVCDEAGADSDLTISQVGSTAFFQVDGVILAMKLVDAQFPPYAQVIPKTCSKSIAVNRLALGDAIRAVSLASKAETGGVKATFHKDKIAIFSESAASGDGYDSVHAEYDGPSLTVGFSAKYMNDALGAFDSETVTIGMTGELDPILIQQAGESMLAVIMPMRVT